MSRKKLIGIVCIVLAVLTAVICFIVFKDNEDDQQQPQEFKTDIERYEYIQEFSKLQGENKEVIHDDSSGGFKTLSVQNLGDLMKFGDVDFMVSVEEKILNGAKIMPQIITDIEGKNSTAVEEYYNNNKDIFIRIFGIDTSKEFLNFTKGLSFLNSGSQITEAIIDPNSITIKTNIVSFDLNLKTNTNNTKSFSITAIITVKERISDSTLFWKTN